MSDADDALRSAGRFFTGLGGKLKQAGGTIKQTSKQVTGLGRGGVGLELDKLRVAPGALLQGRVVLRITEPVEAKRLVVTLRARQKIVSVSKNSNGRSVGTSYAGVYQFEQELSGAKLYEPTQVSFELTVPPDALDMRPSSSGSSPLVDAVRVVASALTPSAGPIEWQVLAALEIPWGRDLTTEMDVVVAR